MIWYSIVRYRFSVLQEEGSVCQASSSWSSLSSSSSHPNLYLACFVLVSVCSLLSLSPITCPAAMQLWPYHALVEATIQLQPGEEELLKKGQSHVILMYLCNCKTYNCHERDHKHITRKEIEAWMKVLKCTQYTDYSFRSGLSTWVHLHSLTACIRCVMQQENHLNAFKVAVGRNGVVKNRKSVAKGVGSSLVEDEVVQM